MILPDTACGKLKRVPNHQPDQVFWEYKHDIVKLETLVKPLTMISPVVLSQVKPVLA